MCEPRDDTDQLEAIASLTSAVRSIAHGGVDGPGGLEALAMTVSGDCFNDSPTSAIREAGAEIAGALTAIAEALESKGND